RYYIVRSQSLMVGSQRARMRPVEGDFRSSTRPRADSVNIPSSGSHKDVRMRGFQDRSEVADVVHLLKSRLKPLASQREALHEADGRSLAAEVIAEVSVPAFHRAAMDGYALRGGE